MFRLPESPTVQRSAWPASTHRKSLPSAPTEPWKDSWSADIQAPFPAEYTVPAGPPGEPLFLPWKISAVPSPQ